MCPEPTSIVKLQGGEEFLPKCVYSHVAKSIAIPIAGILLGGIRRGVPGHRTSYHLSILICHMFLPHLHDRLTTNPAGIIARTMTQHGHQEMQEAVANNA